MEHAFTKSGVCDRCGVTLKALAEARRQPSIRWMKTGFELYVGSWASRVDWGPGHFGWREGDGAITRFIRKWWSGWHRWDECEPW